MSISRMRRVQLVPSCKPHPLVGGVIDREAEAVGNFTVFNIKGNRYRLIVDIDYESGVIYFKYFLTHADYDKDRWKNDAYF
jgi:mRNA interferase HigB